MIFDANIFQINNLFSLLKEEYIIYGPVRNGNVSTYKRIEKAHDIDWRYQRTIMPFKKILFPDGQETEATVQKIAFVGMPLCDIAALKIFLKQFEGSHLLPSRNDLFIIGSDCQPDDNCFCNNYDLKNLYDFDLYISARDNFLIKTSSWRGEKIVEKIGLKKSTKKLELGPTAQSEVFDLELTKKNIDNRTLSQDFWQGISNNCFGCGACSTVCPLCFCFRQDYKSCSDGSDKKCLNWDTCFGSEFSQIQNGYDLRPKNSDRLYNWYHHKFVRGPRELDNPLCVGCGRCITACPAHLSIHNIIHTLNKKHPENE